MKKLWICGLVLSLLLAGCAEVPVEQVSDFWQEPASAPCSIQLDYPKEAAEPVLEQDGSQLYLCDGYELCLQTVQAENLSAVLQTLTGFPAERLTLIRTGQGDLERYDFVWCSAGENGEQVGRGAVLTDGTYYYCVSVLSPESVAGELRESWQRVFDSISLA